MEGLVCFQMLKKAHQGTSDKKRNVAKRIDRSVIWRNGFFFYFSLNVSSKESNPEPAALIANALLIEIPGPTNGQHTSLSVILYVI